LKERKESQQAKGINDRGKRERETDFQQEKIEAMVK
jgi:hypothetical protein